MAIDAYNTLLASNPDEAYAIKGLGEAYIANHDLAMARKQYDKLLMVNKDLASRLRERIDAAAH